MVKLVLYNELKDQSIGLEDGLPVQIGRGFFEVTDKRISRQHAIITRLQEKLLIKACHVNPIFYKTNGSTQHQILHKDLEVLLAEKDKFSLLPNELEFEIRIVQDPNIVAPGEEESAAGGCELRVRNISEINVNLEAGNLPTSMSQIMTNVAQNSDADSDRTPSDLERTPSPDVLAGTRARKRSLDENGDHEKNKKIKGTTSNHQNQAIDGSTSSAAIANANPSNNLQQPNQIPISVVIKPDPDAPSTSIALAAQIFPGKIKSDPDAPTSSTSSSAFTPNVAVKIETNPSPPSASNAVAAPVDPVKVKPEPNAAAVPLQTAPQQATNAPPLRPSCDFGVRCYRRTDEHRREFAHPPDVDYRRPDFPPPPADAPNCPWGAACYRRNPDHFSRLQHPPSNIYLPAAQPAVVAPAALRGGAPSRSRGPLALIVYDDESDSEDDSDQDDLDFMNLSQETEENFDDSDDDEMGNESESQEDEDNNLEE